MSTIYKKSYTKAVRIQEQADCEFKDKDSFSGSIRNISVTVIFKQVWICLNLQWMQEIVYPKIQSPRCESKHSNQSNSQDKYSRRFNSNSQHTYIKIRH